jgi:multiple sugar transport system ATP-binding protein
MTMGDRVAVLKDGLLQQCDTPRVLYDRPSNVFVAGFIGSPAMNLRMVKVIEGGVDLAGTTVPIDRTILSGLNGSDSLTVGFRPESVEMAGDSEGFPITVHVVEELGSDAYLYGALEGSDPTHGEVDVIARVDPRNTPKPGDVVRLSIRPDEIHAFHADSGERIS